MITEILDFNLLTLKKVNITISDILLSIAIIFITSLIIRFLRRLVSRSTHNIENRKNILAFFGIAKYLIWIVVFLFLIQTIGFNINLLIAGSTALLVGIGIGLQQIFSDFISGFFLLFEGSIREGDIVEVNNIVGKVEKINLRTSIIFSRDNIAIIVPNSKFITDNVVNWSYHQEVTRFNLSVGVAYGSDVPLVMKTLLSCIEKPEAVVKEPKPFVRFTDFADSSLNFEVFFWTEKIFNVENIKSDMRIKIDAAFREKGITIPFPQRDVHVTKSVL